MPETEKLEDNILALLIQLAPDAMIVADEDGVIRFANNQVESLFEYKPEEIMGNKVELLIPERLRVQHVKHRATFTSCPITRPMGANLELTGRKKSGIEFPVEISLSPLRSGNKVFATAAIRDVTEKKIKEKKLVAANKNLERFVYIASHDLQEPLRTIQQLLQILDEEAQNQLDENTLHLIARIMKASGRMSTLIQDLLNYARLGKSRELQKVDCKEILEEVINNLKGLIEANKGQVLITTPLPVLEVYPTEFRLLFQNLIDNGIKFHKKDEKPILKISAQKGYEEWVFSIEDNGIGIENKYFTKLFEVFQRLHNRDEYPGNGIGLAHCRRIIELHGGRIWLDSTLGQGTTFHFTIPSKIKELT